MSFDDTSIHSKKRGSSESSVFRLRQKEKKPLFAQHDSFPSVENAVKHFMSKLEGPQVVSVSIPLKKRQNSVESIDEHRLKYHHRSVDELEKISHNSERLRTVIDEDIDLDYIDIVYEANKPSKQKYMSLSSAPPSIPKYFSRRIKLQQRNDSRESSARDSKDRIPEHSNVDPFGSLLKQADNVEICDSNSNIGKQAKHKNNYVKNIAVKIEYGSDNQLRQPNITKPELFGNRHISATNEHNIDPVATAHRYSYFSQSNNFWSGVNRANTRDIRKIFRYSKHISQNFRPKHHW